jgi:pimeloyl-ACP methyl ester carboxylesterase
MVWAWDEEEWRASDVEALTGHLDHEFRAIVGTSDDRMVAVATALSHPDIETWQWRAED